MPAGFPDHFALGLGNRPEHKSWMTQSGSPWDFRYQYITGDVTADKSSGANWTGWNSPPGQFATNYMNSSANDGYVPVFIYYTIVPSAPNPGSENLAPKFSSASTMAAYFEDWVLLMERAALFGDTVIVHHEPDAWGWIQKRSSNPHDTYVAVADSGVSGLSGFGNDAAGFAQALVALRDQVAPNVIIAWHASPWAGGADFTYDYGTVSEAVQAGHNIAGFYNSLNAEFDLIFTDPSDRDWGFLLAEYGQDYAVWNDATFDRFREFSATLHGDTGKPLALWQLPIGNTIYRTMDNTKGHYQDNQVEYFLLDEGYDRIAEHIEAGVIALMYGRGAYDQTTYLDGEDDGVTNPSPVNGNSEVSEWPDDDGGLLRMAAADYYNSSVSLPVCSQ